MKPKSGKQTDDGGSHATCQRPTGGQARPGSKGNMRPAIFSSKAVIAPPAVSEATMQHELLLAYEGETETILRSTTGEALFAFIRLADGTLKAVASPELKGRMLRLARGDKNDGVYELAGALRRLKQLPTETPDIIYRNKLDSSLRVNLACMVRDLQSFVSRDESTLADVFQKALDALRSTFITPKNAKADSIKVKIPWGLFGVKAEMPLSLTAIIYARQFAQQHGRLPKKRELRDVLEIEHAADLSAWKRQNEKSKIADSTWADVWTDAGLNGLPRAGRGMSSRKTGRKR